MVYKSTYNLWGAHPVELMGNHYESCEIAINFLNEGVPVDVGEHDDIYIYIYIWVCLKMGYTPNYSHLVGIMIINHWV